MIFTKNSTLWRLALLCCCGALIIGGLIRSDNAKADPTTFTLYTQAVDGVTDNASPDFPAPGSTFVQASPLYTNPGRTGDAVGTIYISCNQLLTLFDAMCIASLKSANGTDAVSVQGYYSEAAELLNNCGPIVQVLSVIGGIGAYNGAQGQVTVTHTPVNPQPPSQNCAHTVHDFSFAVSLKHPPNGE